MNTKIPSDYVSEHWVDSNATARSSGKCTLTAQSGFTGTVILYLRLPGHRYSALLEGAGFTPWLAIKCLLLLKKYISL